MSFPSLSIRLPTPLARTGNPRNALAGLLDRLLTRQERAYARRRLRALDPHLLRDIGLGRSSADFDPPQPFLRD